MKIDYTKIGQIVREKREAEGLSLRDLQSLTGISASTLSRTENGKTLEPDNLFALIEWSGIDLSEVVVLEGNRTSTIAAIKLMLHSDPSLSDESAAVIAKTVKLMYSQLAA